MSAITPQQVIARRALEVKHPVTGMVTRYTGDRIYSITPLGVVIAIETVRLLFPWSKVESFTYHMADEKARKVVQGF